MTKPNISKQEALEMIIDRSLNITETVKVLAIRGYYKNTMGKPGANDRSIYDDAFCLIGPNVYMTFNANTDPSKYKPGIATLAPGVHYFKKGLHGFGRKTPAYLAFRPDTADESLPVTRDGQQGIKKGQYINIHKGGEKYTNSAGCQTVHPDQWLDFQKTVYSLMSSEGQKRLPYILIENK